MSKKRATPGSQTSLREANRARIVDAVKHHGGLTQIELAGVTGLSPATVSNIVKELVTAGVLATTMSTRSGRRAHQITLARALGLVAGVHFSERHMRVALSDVAHTVVAEHHMPLAKDHRADNELNRAAQLITDMLESVDATHDEILAVGLAMPAPMDQSTGIISRTGIMRGWDGVPVAESLGIRLNSPVYVDNNANMGALAEYRTGALRGKPNSLYVSIDDGIGAGLILNGAVFRGHHGTAGEFGHMVLDEDGALCRCGNRGCLETLAGGQAIVESVRTGRRGLKLHDVVVRAIAGDNACIRAIADAGRHLGIAAGNLSNVFDPERIAVGGELSQAGELLLGPMRHAMERSVIVGSGQAADLVQSQLGPRSELLGSIAFAIDQLTIGADATLSAEPAEAEAS
ncbi:ROK family transcriptional regulator [Salinibacterium sp. NG253]|uniref:ROK family transcriptional regulator n=1 Tax=unclassified Salinibacterium TaxID=2632331 RepID=UPI0018CD7964|nr:MULTISPECIES: ROK family transcriptional regulator [unclassified Salinibacterium]MBH0117222.1 ROK family transcriptional regulator [Salinibacterium sp. NG253]MBH0130815.1 ROK family transcriptional regulator [Salinibacterium sp. NK8237]